MDSLRQDLDKVYTSDISKSSVLQEKAKIIQLFKKDFRKNYESYFKTPLYLSLPDQEINNAYILSLNRYTGDLSLFYELHEHFGRSLPDTFRAILSVENHKGNPKIYLKELLRQ